MTWDFFHTRQENDPPLKRIRTHPVQPPFIDVCVTYVRKSFSPSQVGEKEFLTFSLCEKKFLTYIAWYHSLPQHDPRGEKNLLSCIPWWCEKMFLPFSPMLERLSRHITIMWDKVSHIGPVLGLAGATCQSTRLRFISGAVMLVGVGIRTCVLLETGL